MIRSRPTALTPLDSMKPVACPGFVDYGFNFNCFLLETAAQSASGPRLTFLLGASAVGGNPASGIIGQLQARGVKSLRIPIEFDKIWPTWYTLTSSAATGFVTAQIDNLKLLSSICVASGMSNLVLDPWHGNINSASSGWVNMLKTDATARAKFVEFWDQLAFQLRGYYSAYNIINEAIFTYNNASASTFYNMMASAVAAIQARDSNVWCVVPGLEYSGARGLDAMTPLPYSKIIYEIHSYEPFVFTHGGASFLAGDTNWDNLQYYTNIIFPPTISWWNSASGLLATYRGTADYVAIAVSGYYFTENHETSMRASLQPAIDWARKNQVPLLMGEYGTSFGSRDIPSHQRWYRYMSRILTANKIGRCIYPTSREGYWNKEYPGQFLDFSAVAGSSYPTVWNNAVWKAAGYMPDDTGFDYGTESAQFPKPLGFYGASSGVEGTTTPPSGDTRGIGSL